MKHTQGEWIIRIHPTLTQYTLDLEAMGIDSIKSDENAANKNLIESAPEILKELIEIEKLFKIHYDHGALDPDFHAEWILIKQAIEKATK